MSKEDEVRKASEQFYAALNRMLNGNAGPLADIWLHSAVVTTMHPIGGRQVGWDAVRASFEQVAQLAADGKVEPKDSLIQVAGIWPTKSASSMAVSTLSDSRSPLRSA